MSVSSAPHIAEFPVVKASSGFMSQSLEVVPVEVLHGWVVRTYGVGELPKLSLLPTSVIAALYPDVVPDGVAAFSLIRDSPAFGLVQELLDTVSSAVRVVDDEFQSSWLLEETLERMYGWSMPGSEFYFVRSMAVREWAKKVPEARELCENLMWAVTETLIRSLEVEGIEGDYSYWSSNIYELCLLVCVYYVSPPSMREAYLGKGDKFAEVFAVLGISEGEELARMMGDDDEC